MKKTTWKKAPKGQPINKKKPMGEPKLEDMERSAGPMPSQDIPPPQPAPSLENVKQMFKALGEKYK